MQQLRCAVQNYAWGKLGSHSAVALLAKEGHSVDLNEDVPYAELWIGTHKSGPSRLSSSELLSDWIQEHPLSLGKQSTRGNGQLTFLFKVLSVNKSLSIQAHPNKELAEELHKREPDQYKDDNHKPEMAIALTPFEALCGFRPHQDIVNAISGTPELKALIEEENLAMLSDANNRKSVSAALKRCFTALMTAHPATVSDNLTKLIQRLQNDDCSQREYDKLVLRIHNQFPGDVGCFVVYFLNYITLQPGEAIFLEANLPHAYLAGDTIECMACSDNVVRAGLTPKHKDVSTLCDMLSYTPQTVQQTLFPSQPHPTDRAVTVYDPPIDDFIVTRIQLSCDTSSYTMSALQYASVILVISGKCRCTSGEDILALHKGCVIFIPASHTVNVDRIEQDVLIFRASSGNFKL